MRSMFGRVRWAAIVASAALLMVLLSPTAFSAAKVEWQQGASIQPASPTDFASPSFRESLSRLADANANFVTLVIPLTQSGIHATDVQRSSRTPTDEALADGIAYAHDLGLGVNLAIMLGTGDGQWRARINPDDRDAWFAAYGAMLDHYARLAEEHEVEQMTLGVELIKMASGTWHEGNTASWRDMIASVRDLYTGSLTYSANWGDEGWVKEIDQIEFWDDLDFIGVSAYFEFSHPYTADSLREEWDAWNRTHIKPTQERYGKPVIFAEVGYRSMSGALERPWNYEVQNEPSQAEQADGYRALLSYWRAVPYFSGVHFWDWESNPNAGGPGTTTYTPQNKQAEEVMRAWFGTERDAPPPVETALIYDDRLRWDNWSWSASLDTQATAPVFQGSRSMRVAYQRAWAGASFYAGPFSTSPYQSVRFAIHPGSSQVPTLEVALYDQSGNALAEVIAGDYSQSAGNGWHLVSIPLSELRAEDRTITRIHIQEGAGTTPPAFHIDALGFSGDDTPPPPDDGGEPTPTPAPTPTPTTTPTPPPPTQEPETVTRTVAVSASSDDAYAGINPGWPGYSATSTGIYAGAPGSNGPAAGGWRFTGLDIPAGATIIEAHVELNQHHWGYDVTTSLTFEDSAVPAGFSSESTPADRLLNSTAFNTSWTFDSAKPGTWFQTPSLAAGLQELVDTYGDIQQVVLLEDGTGVPASEYHYWASFDSGPAVAARLVVNYSTAAEE